MELYNITINENNLEQQLQYEHWSKLVFNSAELLNLDKPDILSNIATKILTSSGFCKHSTFITVSPNPNYKKIISEDNSVISPVMILYLMLDNTDNMIFFHEKKSQILYSSCEKYKAVLVSDSNICVNISNSPKLVMFSFYRSKPRKITYFESNFTNIVSIQPLNRNDFFSYNTNISLTNNIVNSDIINNFLNNDITMKQLLHTSKYNIILNVNNSSITTNMECDNYINDNNIYFDSIKGIYDFFYINCIMNTCDKNKIQTISSNINKYVKDFILQHTRFTNTHYYTNIFINNNLSNVEDLFILSIVKQIFTFKLGNEYNNTLYDITISKALPTMRDSSNSLLYSVIFCFDKLDNNNYIVLSDNNNIYSNHLHIIKPNTMSIIGFQPTQLKKYCLDTEKCFFINIFKYIAHDAGGRGIGSRGAKTYIKNTIESNLTFTDINTIMSNIDYKPAEKQNITVLSSDDFKYDKLMSIYNTYFHLNSHIHFFYNPGIAFNTCNNDIDNLRKTHKYNLDSLFHPVLKKINTIVLEYDFCEIKNSDVIFPSIIDIYKKVIINILNNNNSYKNFYINVEKCCIIKNDQSKYNLIYDDILDNPDDNLIIYANINIDDKSELFGNITISTNYSNKDVFLKNSLLFIIEASTN